jgi:hypothetical protein
MKLLKTMALCALLYGGSQIRADSIDDWINTYLVDHTTALTTDQKKVFGDWFNKEIAYHQARERSGKAVVALQAITVELAGSLAWAALTGGAAAVLLSLAMRPDARQLALGAALLALQRGGVGAVAVLVAVALVIPVAAVLATVSTIAPAVRTLLLLIEAASAEAETMGGFLLATIGAAAGASCISEYLGIKAALATFFLSAVGMAQKAREERSKNVAEAKAKAAEVSTIAAVKAAGAAITVAEWQRFYNAVTI